MFSLNRPTVLGPWRAAAIAVVGVLAVGIGVAAGSFLLGNRTALGPAAAYVPAGVPIYLELRVEPSAAQDTALRAILARFGPIDGLDTDRPLHEQLTERLDEMLAAENVELTWAADVAPWFDGRLAIAVTDVGDGLAAMPGDLELPQAPPAIMLLGVTDAAAADAAVDRILGVAHAPTFTEMQHNGITLHVADGDAPSAFALTDDQLILGADEASVVAALDAHANPAGTLARQAGMAEMVGALPSDWLAFAAFDASSTLQAALDEVGSEDPVAAVMATILEHQPKRSVMAFSAAGDRLLVDAASELPTGPFAVDNADRGLAADVPGNVLFYSEAVNLGAVLTGILEPVLEAIRSDPELGGGFDLAEGVLGGDLVELVSWIDDAAIVAGMDDGAPFGGLIVSPTSTEAAERRLGQLTTFANLAGMDPTSGISVTTTDVAGIEVTTLRVAATPPIPDAPLDIPTEVVVEWAVTVNRAFIGFGNSFVADMIMLADGDALAAQPRFADAVAELGGTSHAGLTWVDLRGLADMLGDVLGPMTAAGVDANELLGPLDRLVSVSRVEGNLLVQRTVLLLD